MLSTSLVIIFKQLKIYKIIIFIANVIAAKCELNLENRKNLVHITNLTIELFYLSNLETRSYQITQMRPKTPLKWTKWALPQFAFSLKGAFTNDV